MNWKHKEFKYEENVLEVEIDIENELEVYIENSFNEHMRTWLTKEQALELAEFIIEGYKDD